jgi:hypothetical protein
MLAAAVEVVETLVQEVLVVTVDKAAEVAAAETPHHLLQELLTLEAEAEEQTLVQLEAENQEAQE